jgi:hypothetical protein
MNSLKKLLLLNITERKMLFEAVITLFWVKILVVLSPLRWYANILGKERAVTPEDMYANEIIFEIARAIVRGRKVFPWKTLCLCEAVTAKIMLNRRQIVSTLYLGVAKEKGTLIAHAWLRCGTTYVTGKQGMERFTVVSTFA